MRYRKRGAPHRPTKWTAHAAGTDPLRQEPLVVCGFGWPAPALTTTELDPTDAVWQASDSPCSDKYA